MGIKKWLVLLSLCLGFIPQAGAVRPYGDGEPIPWPWGTECPFQWESFAGRWIERLGETGDVWEFLEVSREPSGTHIFEVNRYDSEGEVVAFGRGVASNEDRIIRAVMKPASQKKTKPLGYYVIIRSYAERDKFNCGQGPLVTVLTTRPLKVDSPSRDVHYVLRRLPDTSRR